MAPKRKADPPPPDAPTTPEESDSEEEEVEEVEGSHDEEEDVSDSSSSSDEESKRETMKEMLQPLSKEQLISILSEAAAKDPSLVSGLINSAKSDPIHRKIFVHGLPRETTNHSLEAAFRPYGHIEECNAVLDRATGRCKGFGFVLFKSRAAARKALKEPQKKIGSRMASCQLAAAGPPSSDSGGRKLYVANVGPQVGAGKLRAFFEKFGEIEEGPSGFDKATGKFRGFAIFLYKSAVGMKKALQEPVKEFEGCKLMCSVFVEGRGSNKTGNSGQAYVPTATSSGAAFPNVAGFQNYPAGLSQAMATQAYPGSILIGQNPGLGGFNPLMASYQAGMGLQASLARTAGGFGGQQDVNTISPSIIDAYNSRAALKGLGVVPNTQPGQGSFPGSSAAAARGQSGARGHTSSSYYSR